MSNPNDDRKIVEIARDPEVERLLLASRNEAIRHREDPEPGHENEYLLGHSMWQLCCYLLDGKVSRFQILFDELERIVIAISFSRSIPAERMQIALQEGLIELLSEYENHTFRSRSFSRQLLDDRGEVIRGVEGDYFENSILKISAGPTPSALQLLSGGKPTHSGNYSIKHPVVVYGSEMTQGAFEQFFRIAEAAMRPIIALEAATPLAMTWGGMFTTVQDDPLVLAQRRAQADRIAAEGVELVKRLFELVLFGVPEEQSMKQRLKRSLVLMIDAFTAKPRPSAILLFAAVESLVGCPVPGTTRIDIIASNTAVLLQPDPTKRLVAIEAIKKLFGERDVIVHGIDVQFSKRALERIRKLAYGLLRAVVQWMHQHDDISEAFHSEDRFFESLRNAFVRAETFAGISPQLEGCLPREDETQA